MSNQNQQTIEGLEQEVEELKQQLEEKETEIRHLITVDARKELDGLRSVLRTQEQRVEELEAGLKRFASMRTDLHSAYNGGWHGEDTNKAFHHGMDTVCNVIEAGLGGQG
jgi:predicted RNase H-like nuclease (RuvC/YqgF family)